MLTTLMSLYWTADETIELREAQMQMWLTDLAEFDLECITYAVTEWRQEETRRPVPAELRRLAIQAQRKRDEALRLPPPPQPRFVNQPDSEERRVEKAELAAEGRAILDEWARLHGYPDFWDHAWPALRPTGCNLFTEVTKWDAARHGGARRMPLHPAEVMSEGEKDRVRHASLEAAQ